MIPADKKSDGALKGASARPLEGVSVGLSISLGEDSYEYGFSEEEMNRALVRLSDSLLSAGANLVFGHDWRPNGVMAAVAKLAVSFDAGIAPSRAVSGPRSCRITNLVPWGRPPSCPLIFEWI